MKEYDGITTTQYKVTGIRCLGEELVWTYLSAESAWVGATTLEKEGWSCGITCVIERRIAESDSVYDAAYQDD